MADILSFLSFLDPRQYGLNILDLIIIIVILFYAIEGYTLGFVVAFVDLISFILSFILALKFYGLVAKLLMSTFSIPLGFANALGFFVVALTSEIVINILLRRLVHAFPPVGEDSQYYPVYHKVNRYLGLLPGMASSFIILSFLLSIIISLPSSPFLKNVVTSSVIGKQLVANAATFEKGLNDVFGGALSETLNFLTVKPQSDETINLNFHVTNGTVDAQSEHTMFQMINKERNAQGLQPLTLDTSLRDLARDYSEDMFARGYFSHYNPEGQSPFHRMDEYSIQYMAAGENLALAPSVELAMQGLMNSPGHRANILSPNFNKIGIGVIDGGIYGKMFTQEFTN